MSTIGASHCSILQLPVALSSPTSSESALSRAERLDSRSTAATSLFSSGIFHAFSAPVPALLIAFVTYPKRPEDRSGTTEEVAPESTVRIRYLCIASPTRRPFARRKTKSYKFEKELRIIHITAPGTQRIFQRATVKCGAPRNESFSRRERLNPRSEETEFPHKIARRLRERTGWRNIRP